MAEEIEKIINNLMFLPLDMEPAPSFVCEQIESVSVEDMVHDPYRNTYRLPFMSGTRKQWYPVAHEFPDIKKYIEECIFPFTGVTRTIFLVTPSGWTMPPHIDSNRESYNKKTGTQIQICCERQLG